MSNRTRAISLWDGVAPGSEGWTQIESEWSLPPPVDVTMLWNVVHPTVTPILPNRPDDSGLGVVVCPGGGYFTLAIAHEGFEVAERLAARGIAAFVLKYRVMETPDSDDERMKTLIQVTSTDGMSDVIGRMEECAPIAHADGVAALQLVRNRSQEWGIRPDRLGVLGFSAGGRLAVDLATSPRPLDRPDFVGAIYGAGSPNAVPSDAPPLFLAAAEDDLIFDRVLRTDAAWRLANCPVESHFYERGGHGFGVRSQNLPSDLWIDQFLSWMKSQITAA
jgi:acetyl esterase/lipase